MIGCAFYAVVTIAFGFAGIPCAWLSVFLSAMLVPGVLWAISKARGRSLSKAAVAKGAHAAVSAADGPDSKEPSGPRAALVKFSPFAYVAISLIVSWFIFISALPAPDSFVQSWDNVHHLDAVRGFVDSGQWTSLSTSLYLGADASIDPFVEGSFYPSVWHVCAAMIASLFQASAPFAINVVNVVVIAVAHPLATYAFVRALVGSDSLAIPFGSLFVLANPSCPWMLMTWGPLFPNIMANSLVPAFSCVFIILLADDVPRTERFKYAAAIVLAVIAFAFVQPNGLFAAAVLLAPYCVVRVHALVRAHASKSKGEAASKRIALVAALAAVCAIVALWSIAYVAPFMQGVVQYTWPADTSVADALMDVVTQRFHNDGVAIGCSLLILLGVVAVVRTRQNRWIACSWLFACALYVAAVSASGFLQHYLAGFWYTDAPRIAALAAMAALPLQAMGLAWLIESMAERGRVAQWVSALLVFAICVFVYLPVDAQHTQNADERRFTDGSALNREAQHIAWEYGIHEPQVYGETERRFVEQVLATVPAGSIVINEPNDGSAYAYGTSGLRTYYRYWRGYGDPEESEKPESVQIRRRLVDIATNENVRKAVQEVGATYVLQLDHWHKKPEQRMWVYGNGGLWRGVDTIGDGTPGFEVVLSQGDMRLYRILDEHEAS